MRKGNSRDGLNGGGGGGRRTDLANYVKSASMTMETISSRSRYHTTREGNLLNDGMLEEYMHMVGRVG